MIVREYLGRLEAVMVEGLVFLVRVYRVTLSPWLGGQCRFSPSCSDYFIRAVRKRGVVRGTLMGIWRILRCNPFSKGGYDPVP